MSHFLAEFCCDTCFFSDTVIGEIETFLKRLLARKDIGIVLINQHVS